MKVLDHVMPREKKMRSVGQLFRACWLYMYYTRHSLFILVRIILVQWSAVLQ